MNRFIHLFSAAGFAALASLLIAAADAGVPASYDYVTTVHAPGPGAYARLVSDTPDTRKDVHFRRLDRMPEEMEPVTFLGVETAPVSPTLIAQLSLPDNAGLVVLHVVHDSAAATALKDHDILLKLDDQILVDQHQLGVLIRNHKDGDEVMLTYLRTGKTTTAKVKLTKHDAPKMTDVMRPTLRDRQEFHFEGPGQLFGHARDDDDRENVERVLSLIDAGPGVAPLPPGYLDIGKPTQLRSTSINRENSNLVYSDEKGSLELTLKNGHKSLVAKDEKGAQLFSGPVDTPEQRLAMPAEIRARLDKLESMQNVTFHTDPDFEGGKTLIYQPAGKVLSLPRAEPLPNSHLVL